MNARFLFTRRALVRGAGASAALYATRGWVAETESICETTSGKVRGVVTDGGVHLFRGISYGASTAETGRFLPPRKPKPWAGVKDAVEYGARSWQTRPNNPRNGLRPMSEECLFLNVWTPALDGNRRPVMVYFHGGGFATGSGEEAYTNGINLAQRHDVVVVTVNHRLNIFGYLDLSELGGRRFAQSGNAGMLDAVLALEWVRDNIGRMGGNPGNVTIFGQSGGGMKVNSLLAMPAAKGLIHRGISQSGATLRTTTQEEARTTARELMKLMNLEPNEVEKLQKAPPESLIAAMGKLTVVPGGLGSHTPRLLSPVVDGETLPYQPCDPKGLAISANVPMMIGSVHDEAAWQAPQEMDDAELRKRVDPIRGAENTTKLLELARKAHPGATNVDLWVILASESFRDDGIAMAERKAALGKAPAYVYVFAWEDEVRKAFHTIEIPFAFDHPELIRRRANGSPEADGLVKVMSDTWVAFAKTGNPNHPGLPQWPAFQSKDRPTMVFDAESKVVSDPTKTDRLILKQVEG